MSDEDIIREHDGSASQMGTGTSFYLDELRRRDAVSAEKASYALAAASQNLARRTFWLTVASFVVATVAAVAAVASIWIAIALAGRTNQEVKSRGADLDLRHAAHLTVGEYVPPSTGRRLGMRHPAGQPRTAGGCPR